MNGKEKEKVMIFDLEDTLTDASHRIHLAHDNQWEKFHELFILDKPKVPIAILFAALIRFFPIIICTGKPETGREDVVEWLNGYHLRPHLLLMRLEEDYRPTSEVKSDMIREIRSRNLDPIAAFDDDYLCCVMYRANGLTTLQVSVDRERKSDD